MKIIDEKGRLFGKVNLIDLAVVLILVVAVAAVGMKLFGNKAVSAATSQQVTLTYEVVAQDVPQHVADYCTANVGGQLLSSTIEVNTAFSNSTYSVGSQEVRVGIEHLVKTSDIEVEGVVSSLEVEAHG